MNFTTLPQEPSRPFIDPAFWRGLTASEKRLWREWREAHPADEWRPLVGAIIKMGYRLPPTEPESEMLWPIVDGNPNRVAEWFTEGAKPQGSLRMQPSWAMVLRHILTMWDELRDAIPEDEEADWRLVRSEGDAKEVLRRIGWYRDP